MVTLMDFHFPLMKQHQLEFTTDLFCMIKVDFTTTLISIRLSILLFIHRSLIQEQFMFLELLSMITCLSEQIMLLVLLLVMSCLSHVCLLNFHFPKFLTHEKYYEQTIPMKTTLNSRSWASSDAKPTVVAAKPITPPQKIQTCNQNTVQKDISIF